MNALTALRIALYANIVLIFLVPRSLVVVPIVTQVGIIVALTYLRRRRRLDRTL